MGELRQEEKSRDTETTEGLATNGGSQSGGSHKELITALQQNWKREREGARTYHDLAAHEHDSSKRAILERLAQAEEHHAEKWERKLTELGASPPPLRFGWRDKLQAWVRRGIGTEAALRQMEAAEDVDIARYEAHAQAVSDADAARMLREVRREEEAHGRVIRDMIGPNTEPQSVLDMLLRRESWHKRGGGWIGDAIYGANDGLGAVFGIVSGVAGATGNSQTVLIAGLAGMLASALSMGSGAYLATKSQREIHQAELDRERKEFEEDPESEREEMELFYQLKGFTEDESRTLVDRIIAQPEQFVRMMAHEELGISEETFPNPVLSALSAAVSTGIGAFIPIIPFFFLSGLAAVIWAAVISLVAHFAVGVAKTLVTGRSIWASGTEMTVVGAIEAAITYGVGMLFHVSGA